MLPQEGPLTTPALNPARTQAVAGSIVATSARTEAPFKAHRVLANRVRLHAAVERLLDDASVLARSIAVVRHRRTAHVLPCKLTIDGLHELEYTPAGASCWTTEEVSLELEVPAGRVLRRIEIDVAGIGLAGRTATISVADAIVWEQRLDDSERIVVRTPRICGAAAVRITLSIPPFIPHEHDEASTDHRRLGLAAREVCLILDDTLPRRLWSLLTNSLRRSTR